MSHGCPAFPITRRRLWRGLALAAACTAAVGGAEPASGLSLAETLAGVLAYTRWPTEPDPVRLCHVGTSAEALQVLQSRLPLSGMQLVPHALAPEEPVAERCDALYVGAMEPGRWQTLVSEIAHKPVLTLCEQSPACAAGGMVRLDLHTAAPRVRFEINLDAVARSAVRIHPQVLRLGQRGRAEAVQSPP